MVDGSQPAQFPPGYRAVLLDTSDAKAALRLAVVVCDPADRAGGAFVLLRTLIDATVYLGCLVDAAGMPHSWVEIWVQNSSNLVASYPSPKSLFCNKVLDDQWVSRAESLRQLDPDGFVVTGWQTANPPPLFLDAELSALAELPASSGNSAWELCTNDATLEAAGLPPYGTSLSRYLFQPNSSTGSRFVPTSADAPENDKTIALAELAPDLVPFNPGAGLMIVRELAPIGCEEWIDVLGGKPWRGVGHGEKAFRPQGIYRTLQDLGGIHSGGGHYFLGRSGRTGRLIETFHLKIEFIGALLQLAHDYTASQQLPFLNLGPESFGVRLPDTGTAMPFFWAARLLPAVPPDAVALPVETTEGRYFLPATFGKASIYRPEAASAVIAGRGEIRIRKVLSKDEEFTAVEGTLATQERLAGKENDLLSIWLTLPSGTVGLYGHFERSDDEAGVEVRFRTMPQKLSDGTVAALKQAEGVVFSKVPFEVLSSLSTPCDLYAIGVLAVRTLLVDDELTLPVALDELLSAVRLAVADGQVGDGLASLAAKDPHIRETLGPHRLSCEEWTVDDAAAVIPERLWWSTLTFVARLFAGLVPASFCADLGDAPALALEKVYDAPLAELDKLRLASRSAVSGDAQADLEISNLVGRYLQDAE